MFEVLFTETSSSLSSVSLSKPRHVTLYFVSIPFCSEKVGSYQVAIRIEEERICTLRSVGVAEGTIDEINDYSFVMST